jgi:hypothetical protein
MNGSVSPRRVILTALFSIWLASQFTVIGLTPAWGVFLPHAHVLRGFLTEADWQAHLEAHRRAVLAAPTQSCDARNRATGGAVLASVPDSAGAISILSLFSADLKPVRVVTSVENGLEYKCQPAVLTAFEITYPPPELPPNS